VRLAAAPRARGRGGRRDVPRGGAGQSGRHPVQADQLLQLAVYVGEAVRGRGGQLLVAAREDFVNRAIDGERAPQPRRAAGAAGRARRGAAAGAGAAAGGRVPGAAGGLLGADAVARAGGAWGAAQLLRRRSGSGPGKVASDGMRGGANSCCAL
jgi:hypothetical protein